MEKNTYLLILLAGAAMLAFGQKPVMELKFTAVNNTSYVQIDSIKVMNRTQGGDTVLYWPDTVLSFYYVRIPEVSYDDKAFRVFQNYPNPVTDQTTISLYIPEKDKVSLSVTDILGRVMLKSERVLEQGTHSFRYTPGRGNLYFFTARWQGQNSSIKILQSGFHSGGTNTLEYTGSETSLPQLKAVQIIRDFFFSPGDELLYIGYVNGLDSGIPDSPEESMAYTFQFATNIPCPGTPTVEYEGQVYNTIQIFSQCWLKENLNVGTMIDGWTEMTDNGIIEKYCYNNEPDSCAKYGGLYQWNEMMQYTTQQGAQGTCPSGWHLPTDEEWKVLEGAVDSQYGIGDPEWETSGEYRGYDAGTNLKTIGGWYGNGNGTDLFGFSSLPGGNRDYFSDFGGVVLNGFWWTSSKSSYYDVWERILICYGQAVYRYYKVKDFGYSVRCLRND